MSRTTMVVLVAFLVAVYLSWGIFNFFVARERDYNLREMDRRIQELEKKLDRENAP